MFARSLKRLVLLAVLLVPAVSPPMAHAQASSALLPAAPSRDESGDDPMGRSTPRGTVLGFMKATGREDYDRAASFLDTRQHGALARELARQLQTILDRETSIDLAHLSRQPEGSLANAQSPNRELVGVAHTSSGKVEIWLSRVQRGDNPPIWLFSSETLRLVPEAYEQAANISAIEQHLPGWLTATFFSLSLWRLCIVVISLPLTLLGGSLLARLVALLLALLSSRIVGRTEVDRAQVLVTPLRLILFGALFAVVGNYSSSLLGRNFWHSLGNVLGVFGVTWLATRLVAIASDLAVARLRQIQSWDKIALAGLLGRLSQIGLATVGVLFVLYLAGVNLTAALTGLGIGGIAVAFAAQRTLENLFGGIMIISDRPVRIGDICKIGNVTGTVVDIGLRSTRIRTPERTIVTIANGQLATMNLENYTFRDKFWFHPLISLSHDTTVDQLQTVLSRIRERLNTHTNVESITSRVSFISIGNASQDIEISAYVFAASDTEFLRIQEELLLGVLDIVESAGTALALPTQVTHVLQQPDADAQGPNDKTPIIGHR